MQINDQDIIRTVQRLRDEENQQLHISPWKRQSRRFPTWLSAIPAAAIIGFLIGIWTGKGLNGDPTLVAMVDTVCVEVHDTIYPEPPMPQPSPTISVTPRSIPSSSTVEQGKAVTRIKKKAARHNYPAGRPMSEDNIRYDLLVKN